MIALIALYATAALFGGMVAFSFLFAPLVFAKLPEQTAGPFIRGVFTWYYLFVTALAALAAVTAWVVAPWAGAVLAAVAVAGLLARQALMPAINRQRDRHLSGDETAGRRFATLHRASVVLNMAQLLAAGVVLGML